MTLSAPQTPYMITFRLAGHALAQVVRWQQQCDLSVVRYKIETQKSAHVIATRENKASRFQRVTEIPEPGDVLPWYGETSSAYSFYFQPTKNGYHLRVINNVGGRRNHRGDGFAWYPEAFPPFELDVVEPITVDMEKPAHLTRTWFYPPSPDWWHLWDENSVDEVLFEIDPTTLQRMTEWGWSLTNIDQYIYRFLPMSVGHGIFLITPETGEQHLFTEDM